MERKAITAKLREYELSHEVTKYKAYDWHVWPYLRLLVARSLYHSKQSQKKQGFLGKSKDIIRTIAVKNEIVYTCSLMINAFYGYIFNWVLTWKNTDQFYARTKEYGNQKSNSLFVFIGFHSRLINISDEFYDPIFDPIVEELIRRNISYVKWYHGDPKSNLSKKGEWISSDLFLRYIVKYKDVPMPSQPDWFKEFAEWAGEFNPNLKDWKYIRRKLRRIQCLSVVYDEWLRKGCFKLLFVYCWSFDQITPATLAASRLGIPVIDVQHGLQDITHPAYSSWNKYPKGRWQSTAGNGIYHSQLFMVHHPKNLPGSASGSISRGKCGQRYICCRSNGAAQRTTGSSSNRY